jgi:murein DD-endopeptidase MepM/ murein hydrolase activator NlpD
VASSAQHPRSLSKASARRIIALSAATALMIMSLLAPQAHGKKSLDELRAGLERLQAELDDATARVEALRFRENGQRFTIARIDQEINELRDQRLRLQDRAVAAARRIYMASNSDTLDVLLSSESVAEIASRSQSLAQVSDLDQKSLGDLVRSDARLRQLQDELIGKTDGLTQVRSSLDAESKQLQARFEALTAEYNDLKQKLAEAARKTAAATSAQVVFSASGMACPIAAPNSFIDSWGYPRSGGRTHEGTDVMAAMGAPVVAITDGRITYEGTGISAGKWLILSGDDGHSYYYMHNQSNLVASGRVKAGQKIATVGDTGNAIGGPPHVHFEYHPGGGGPVNPYPLLAEVCRGER